MLATFSKHLEKDSRHMSAEVQRRKVETGGKRDITDSKSGQRGLWAVRYTKQSALGEAKHLAAGKVTGCLTRRGRER